MCAKVFVCASVSAGLSISSVYNQHLAWLKGSLRTLRSAPINVNGNTHVRISAPQVYTSVVLEYTIISGFWHLDGVDCFPVK